MRLVLIFSLILAGCTTMTTTKNDVLSFKIESSDIKSLEQKQAFIKKFRAYMDSQKYKEELTQGENNSANYLVDRTFRNPEGRGLIKSDYIGVEISKNENLEIQAQKLCSGSPCIRSWGDNTDELKNRINIEIKNFYKKSFELILL